MGCQAFPFGKRLGRLLELDGSTSLPQYCEAKVRRQQYSNQRDGDNQTFHFFLFSFCFRLGNFLLFDGLTNSFVIVNCLIDGLGV